METQAGCLKIKNTRPCHKDECDFLAVPPNVYEQLTLYAFLSTVLLQALYSSTYNGMRDSVAAYTANAFSAKLEDVFACIFHAPLTNR